MIVLSNAAAQTIQPGEDAVFNVAVQRSGCDVLWQGTGPLHLRCGLYEIQFTGNVGGDAATQPSLAIAVDGAMLPETTMTVTTTASTDVFNVHASTLRRNCLAGVSVSVRNTGTTPVTLAANPALVVERKG